MARVAERLHARGDRMTGPRAAVLLALGETPGHLTIDEIADAVARIDPSVHHTSVYRAVLALCELGVVQHIHVGHGATAYHLTADERPHPHAQCRRCGAVLDLPADLFDAVAARLASGCGFELDATHVALSGLCAGCAAT